MPIKTEHLHFYQTLGAITRLPAGFEAGLERERLRVEVVRPDILRVRVSRAGRFEEKPSAAVCAQPGSFGATDFTLEETPDTVTVSTGALALHVTRAPFGLKAVRADGSVIFETACDSGRSLAYGELNSRFVITRSCAQEDAFYGLGEKAGVFNRHGRTFTLWNTDIFNGASTDEFTRDLPDAHPRKSVESKEFDPYYISIPFFYHQPGWSPSASGAPMAGFFIDNPWRGEFEFPVSKTYRFEFLGGQYDEYIFSGPGMPAILEAYTALTGRMAAPPLWALGHHQCRWFDYKQADVVDLAKTYRDRKIPCDVVWLDIDYMDGYRVFTWNKVKFPDPAAMIADLRERGLRVITIIDPGVKHESGNPLFEDGLRDRLFCENGVGTPFVGRVWPGQTVFPDFSLPETRAWWGRLNADHVGHGLAGIWNDMNEPATFLGDLDSMRFDHGRAEHGRFHNEYAMLMAMGTVEGLRAAMPNLRTFVLSRAGSAGIQRYAANWMGDNRSSWDLLWLSLPMAMGLGISGQPFVGADIGGFAGHSEGELLSRWYQCAAFTPFFRNHNCSGSMDQYPWSFGSTVEQLCKEAISERYRLMPYLYACFMEASETGAPIQRPLIFEHQDDAAARNLDDQFLLGSHLLVAPVTAEGQTARHLYLPEGTWRDWWTGEAVSGGRHLLVPTPRDRIPVFARGGAVIPLWTGSPQTTQGHFPEEIELRVIVPLEDGETTSIFHEDDGLTFAHQTGAFFRTTFRVARAGTTLRLAATVSGKGFPEFRRKRFRITLPGLPGLPRIAGGGAILDGESFVLPNSGTPFSLEIAL
ncbi:MAG: glycoside hydrolase family 31 protein [Verrucomicrobiae bacterium]